MSLLFNHLLSDKPKPRHSTKNTTPWLSSSLFWFSSPIFPPIFRGKKWLFCWLLLLFRIAAVKYQSTVCDESLFFNAFCNYPLRKNARPSLDPCNQQQETIAIISDSLLANERDVRGELCERV